MRAAQIVHSIALDGAHIAEVKELHGSLIGPAAIVGGANGTAAHCLLIGDHTRIVVAA